MEVNVTGLDVIWWKFILDGLACMALVLVVPCLIYLLFNDNKE